MPSICGPAEAHSEPPVLAPIDVSNHVAGKTSIGLEHVNRDGIGLPPVSWTPGSLNPVLSVWIQKAEKYRLKDGFPGRLEGVC